MKLQSIKINKIIISNPILPIPITKSVLIAPQKVSNPVVSNPRNLKPVSIVTNPSWRDPNPNLVISPNNKLIIAENKTDVVEIRKPSRIKFLQGGVFNFKLKKLMSNDILVTGVPNNVNSVFQSTSKRNYKAKHPVTNTTMQGLRGCATGVSESSLMTTKEYYEQIANDNMAFTFNAIVPKSQNSYSSAQKAWFLYCETMKTNYLLTVVPPFWREIAEKLPNKMPFKLFMFKGFLSFCVNNKGGKPIKAGSAINYLSAVRKYFQDNGMSADVAMYDTSAELTSARNGLTNEWVGIPGHSKASSQKIPLTADRIVEVQENLLDIKNSCLDCCLYTENITQYSLVCRSSELIYCNDSDHHLISDKVIFVMMPSGQGKYKGIQPAKPLFIESSLAKDFHEDRLCGHIVTIDDSKKDIGGIGDRIPHNRQLNQSSDSLFDLSVIMFRCAKKCQPRKGEPFFSSSIPGSEFVLRRHHLDSWFKKIAEYFNLDPSKISSHSLRYAGASALKAAGYDDSVIMKMGRWDSLAFLRYIRLSIKTYNDAANALALKSTLSWKDVNMMCPAVC